MRCDSLYPHHPPHSPTLPSLPLPYHNIPYHTSPFFFFAYCSFGFSPAGSASPFKSNTNHNLPVPVVSTYRTRIRTRSASQVHKELSNSLSLYSSTSQPSSTPLLVFVVYLLYSSYIHIPLFPLNLSLVCRISSPLTFLLAFFQKIGPYVTGRLDPIRPPLLPIRALLHVPNAFPPTRLTADRSLRCSPWRSFHLFLNKV